MTVTGYGVTGKHANRQTHTVWVGVDCVNPYNQGSNYSLIIYMIYIITKDTRTRTHINARDHIYISRYLLDAAPTNEVENQN